MGLSVDDEGDPNFEAKVLDVHQWKRSGDAAMLQITIDTELIVLRVMRADNGAPLCTEVEFGVLTADEENYFFWKELRFQSPVPFTKDSDLRSDWGQVVNEKLVEFQEVLDAKVTAILGLKWHPQRGRKIPDLYCARLADLFVYLEAHGSKSSVEDCARYLDLGYETVKTRLATARERQLVSTPGKGQRKQSILLPAGIKVLLEKEANEHS